MMSNKKFVLLVLPFFIAAFAEAQTVKVKKENARIKGENTEGFEVTLDGTVNDVNTSFVRFLKTMGKVRQTSDFLTLNEPTINGNAYTLPVFALIKDNGNNASAWIGINAGEWAAGAEKINKELEKVIYDFGVKFYRDKIQVQIDESVRATQAVEKQQQRLVNENKNLNGRLEVNKREKIQLEQSLANNKLEYETLLKKIEYNKKAQDSVAIAGEQIKKVTEKHKERQNKVN